MIADRNFLQRNVIRERIAADGSVVRDRCRSDLRQGESVVSDRGHAGKVGRCAEVRFVESVTADLFQVAAGETSQVFATGESVFADRRRVFRNHEVYPEVTRAGARGDLLCRSSHRVGSIRGCDENEFVVLHEISAVVFRRKCGTFGKIEFRNVRTRKGIFADDGNVFSERNRSQRGTIAEGVRRNNGGVDVDALQFVAESKRHGTDLDLRRIESDRFEMFVLIEGADAERLRAFGKRERREFVEREGIVSDRVDGREVHVRKSALSKRPFVDEFNVFEVDRSEVRTTEERIRTDSRQRGRQHDFFQSRKSGKRIGIDRRNAFGDHDLGDRIFAEVTLLDVVRIFLVDHVSRGSVFLHVFVVRERIGIDRGNASVRRDLDHSAEPSVVHKVNTVRRERIFYGDRDLARVKGDPAVEVNVRHHDRGTLRLRDDRSVFRHRGDRRIADREFNGSSVVSEIRIENVLHFYRFGGEHRKARRRTEIVLSARNADLSFVGRNVVIRFDRFITRQGEFVDFGHGVTAVIPFFSLLKDFDRRLRFYGVSFRVATDRGDRCRSALLCHDHAVDDGRDRFVFHFVVQRFRPAVRRINVEIVGNGFRFVGAEPDRIFRERKTGKFVRQTDLIHGGVHGVVVNDRDKAVIILFDRIIAVLVDLKPCGIFQLFDIIGQLDRHLGIGGEGRINGSDILAERFHAETACSLQDLSELHRHRVVVIVNAQVGKEFRLLCRSVIFGAIGHVRYDGSFEVYVHGELEHVSRVVLILFFAVVDIGIHRNGILRIIL